MFGKYFVSICETIITRVFGGFVATLASLVERVRFELGDMPKSFVTQFISDISTNRYRLEYAPVDGPNVQVFKNGVDISDQCAIEEHTGVLVLDALPEIDDEFTVTGNYYRYFTTAELEKIVESALTQHAGRDVDALGRKITIANLPVIEEYPVALYATTLALYTLATDASFDINIFAPDGVTIPRSERYRQLMEMIDARQTQYRELCIQLGIGMYNIEVFSLRRISQRTNRYVPIYRPQEVDDRSHPQRVDIPLPTYGHAAAPWPTDGGELTAYQGIAYTGTVTFSGVFTDKSFIARLLLQRGSAYVVRNFALSVTSVGSNYTATISLTADETRRTAERTYWQIASVDDNTGEIIEIKGGNFFTERVGTAVLT
jgi:hypothetical protein